ncbi:uncharacterized protein [Dermacentor albipictus]|uniref:uncharacterized protein n=1 Tax=Dermacentor albipictus TaxID=60249 RepID=UPI0031FBCBD5
MQTPSDAMEQGTAAITCSIRGCPNEFVLSDPSHILYVCTADDIQCKEWLAVIPKVSLRLVDDKLCVCSLHFDDGVNVSGGAMPTIFPPVPSLGASTSEPQPQQQSETQGREHAMAGPATTIKQELVDFEDGALRAPTDFSGKKHPQTAAFDAVIAEVVGIRKAVERMADAQELIASLVAAHCGLT